MLDVCLCVVDMKHHSHMNIQSRRLAHYSSGEDDSGTEDTSVRHDVKLRGYLNRSIDFNLKKALSPPVLKLNKPRTSVLDNGAKNSFDPIHRDCSSTTGQSKNLLSSAFSPVASKGVVRHRSPVVRARLWSEHDTVCSGNISIPPPKAHMLWKPPSEFNGSVLTTEGTSFSFRRGKVFKNLENCRKVLSDITKEAVPDFRFQIPSNFPRDVLPLDAEDPSKSNEYFNMEKRKSDNHFVKDECSFNESTVNGRLTRTRTNTLQDSVDMSKEFKTIEEKGWFSLHYQKVSMILVIFVLLFFVGVGIMYLNVRYKDALGNISEQIGNKYPICNEEAYANLCIEKNELHAVIGVLQTLSPRLLTVARDAFCDSSGNTLASMSDDDVLDFIIHHTHYVDLHDAQNVLKNIKLLVSLNPHWDITILKENISLINNESNFDFDQVGYLAFKNPPLPAGCLIKLWLSSILTWISSITAAFIAVSGALFGLWDYKRRYELHRQEVYMFVNKIISVVRNHHQKILSFGLPTSGAPYLPVEACRKEIFGSKSYKFPSAWDDAVKFIDYHESRILTDILEIQGKPTKVWQWLSAATPLSSAVPNDTSVNSYDGKGNLNACDDRNLYDSSVRVETSSHIPRKRNNRRNKVWQGQAFETIAGSPNSLPCSPTPCLKIRHMFDPDLEHGDDWPVLIEDAILEKCEHVCVLHLFVDSSSQEGCVFMKCSSSEEAGKAYRALHGWWFDTKLVTVKYLRVERYHERFPDSANVSHSLRPSNNKRLSLQELWHFPLEST